MQKTQTQQTQQIALKWGKVAAIVASAVLLLVALIVWAGLPDPKMLPYFVLGALVLTGVLAAIGVLGWHLLFRPLPAGLRARSGSLLAPAYRKILAVLVAISGINIVVGGFWDEVWHRAYGLPFGKDLLWRPHLMLYSGFGLVTLLAFVAAIYLLRHGRGSLQQRFRADPVLGLLVLMGAFLIYALPTDPLWHIIYGADITAWSLPHIVLSTSFVLIMVLAAAIQLSTLPARAWQPVTRARAGDWLLLLIGAFMMLVLLQVLVTEWDTGSPVVRTLRPDWLLAGVLATTAAFAGTFITRATRFVGAATVSGLLAIGIRLVLVRAFGYYAITADPWLAVLPALVAIDLWSAVRLTRSGRAPATWDAALAATAGLAVAGFPLINMLFAYPRVGLTNLPLHLLAALCGALGGAWLGVRSGEYLATENRHPETEQGRLETPSFALRLLPAGTLALVLAFVVVFILTAAPPVRG